jgi:hypothetical protein
MSEVSLYPFVLFAHSWLRYAVLGLGLLLLGAAIAGFRASAEWSERDERLHKGFLSALDLQMLLGLLLYLWLSPISAAAFADFGGAMKNAQLRFFGVEHIVTMLLAIAAAHIGRGKSRKRQGRARYRSVLVAQLLWLVLTCAAIPWPVLDIGRPLLRM